MSDAMSDARREEQEWLAAKKQRSADFYRNLVRSVRYHKEALHELSYELENDDSSYPAFQQALQGLRELDQKLTILIEDRREPYVPGAARAVD